MGATKTIKTENNKPVLSDSRRVPELRFKEFEVDWKIENLGSVGSIVNGLTYSPDDINPEGVLVLRSSNVQNGMLYLEDNVYVIAEKFNPVFVDDILICVRNGSKRLIGKNILITENVKGVAFGAFMAIYRSDFNRFLYYFFSSEQYYKEIHKNLGATINSINGSDLRKFKVGFPSLPEQKKIASFLSAVDEKIQQLFKKRALLEDYKKGVMQQLFSGQLRFKDENGNDYPDWEEKRLGEISTKASSNISANTIVENVGEYKIYGASGLLKKIDFFREENPFVSIVKDGAGVGRTLLCEANSSVLGTLDIIKPKNKVVLYFLYSVLNNIRFKKYMVGSTIPHIYYKDYSNEKITIPCFEEQQKVAGYLSSIDAKIESVKNKINQNQSFKKGLLQQMFV